LTFASIFNYSVAGIDVLIAVAPDVIALTIVVGVAAGIIVYIGIAVYATLEFISTDDREGEQVLVAP
jgi:hypothetical protein